MLSSLTCTYFYVGVLNASCASLGLQVHREESLKIKGEYWSCLFASVLWAQVEMEKVKTEHPDIQKRLWPFMFFFFFWQLWLLEKFMEAAYILRSNWCENQNNCSVPLARLVSDDTLALPVQWSAVKKLGLFSVFLLLMINFWGLLP